MTGPQRRSATEFLQKKFEVSQRRAARALGRDRSTVRYRTKTRDEAKLVERLNPLCVRVAMCSPPFSQRVGRHCESCVVKELSVLNAVQDEERSESTCKMLMPTAEFRQIGNVARL